MEDNILLLTKRALGDEFAPLAGELLGESEASIQSALGALLPAVVAATALSGASPGGAAPLLSLLQSPAIDVGVLDSVQGLFGGNGARAVALTRTGAEPARDLLGKTSVALVGALTAGSWIKPTSVTNLLAMAVPLVLAVLKKLVSDHRLDARGLRSVLGRQGPHLHRALDIGMTRALGFASSAAFVESLGAQAREAAHTVGAPPPAAPRARQDGN
jgi:hypothetical protein